jgi:hypothetical protein
MTAVSGSRGSVLQPDNDKAAKAMGTLLVEGYVSPSQLQAATIEKDN